MIFNIRLGTFGGPLRLGDLLGVANVVEHFRQVESNSKIKFYLDGNAVGTSSYIQEFYKWLLENCDYFSSSPGDQYLPWQRVNVWDYRDIASDLIVIPNMATQQKKIVVNPLFDAPYNTYRNWTESVYNQTINEYNQYSDYDKVIISNKATQESGWRNATDLQQVLEEIMTCEIYIGGSTGLSLFASCLDNPPLNIHVMSSRCLLHTLPFRWQNDPRCQIKTYWLDFENTKW